MKRTMFVQKAKDLLTRPITFKGAVEYISKLFKPRKMTPMAEAIIKSPQAERTVDSGLFFPNEKSAKTPSLTEQGERYRKNAQNLRKFNAEHEANELDLKAAEKFIEAGLLGRAEEIGLEFKERGSFMVAAKILSNSGAIPFFELLDNLIEMKLPKIAQRIISECSGPRGLVKYHEMYKTAPAELAEAFTDQELIIYSKKMLLQRKKHHVFQLAEITERAGRFNAAASLYDSLGMHKTSAKARINAHVADGDYLDAAQLALVYNMDVEARELGFEAAKAGQIIASAEIFNLAGDKKTAHAFAAQAATQSGDDPAAVELFFNSADYGSLFTMKDSDKDLLISCARKALTDSLRHLSNENLQLSYFHAHRPEILEGALLLFEGGKRQEAFEFASSMRLLADRLSSPFCFEVAKRIYERGAVSLLRRQSIAPVIPIRSSAAA